MACCQIHNPVPARKFEETEFRFKSAESLDEWRSLSRNLTQI
jgi:hypothetical protein